MSLEITVYLKLLTCESRNWRDSSAAKLVALLTGNTVHPKLAELSSSTLERLLRSDLFESFMIPAAHSILGTASQAWKSKLVDAVCRIAADWTDAGPAVLEFLKWVLPAMPATVYDMVPAVIADLFNDAEETLEPHVLRWLKNVIFEVDPVTQPATGESMIADTHRLECVKQLQTMCLKTLEKAYEAGDDRDAYEPRFDIFNLTLSYMGQVITILDETKARAAQHQASPATHGQDNSGEDEPKGSVDKEMVGNKQAPELILSEAFLKKSENLRGHVATAQGRINAFGAWGFVEEIDEDEFEDDEATSAPGHFSPKAIDIDEDCKTSPSFQH